LALDTQPQRRTMGDVEWTLSPLFSRYVRNRTRICEAVCRCFANEFRGGAGRRGVVGIVADAAAAAKKRGSCGPSDETAG
jgi:hypothetical protein